MSQSTDTGIHSYFERCAKPVPELANKLSPAEKRIFYETMSERDRILLSSEPHLLTGEDLDNRSRLFARLQTFPRYYECLRLLSDEDKPELHSNEFAIISYGPPMWELVVADHNRLQIITAKILPVENRIEDPKTKATNKTTSYVYRPGKVIASVIPTQIIRHKNNTLGIMEKYTITFHAFQGGYFTIHRKTVAEILDDLREKQAIHNMRLIDDYFSMLVTAFDSTGHIDVDNSIETDGFYLVNGKIVESGTIHKDPKHEEIVACIELLDILAAKWKTEYALPTIVKNSMMGPFSLIFKQKKNWLPYTYLYGPRDTGKTVLAMIGLSIWDLDGSHVKGFSSFNSEYKFGEVLSRTSYLQFIDEAGPLRFKEYERIREMIKSAAQHEVARSKGIGPSRSTRFVDIPALSYLIFAANRALPSDEAFMKRMIPVYMRSEDRHPRNLPESRAFEEWFNQERYKLAALGHFTARHMLKSDENVLKLPPRDLARMILAEFYKEAGQEPPKWIDYYAEEDGVEIAAEDIRLSLKGFFLDSINKKYREFSQSGNPFDSLKDKIEFLSKNNLISYLHIIDNEVRITNDILRLLEANEVNLSSLDELASYLPRFIVRRAKPGSKMTARHCATGTLSDFIEFLQERPIFDDGSADKTTEEQDTKKDEDLHAELILSSYLKYRHEHKTDRIPYSKFQQYVMINVKGLSDTGQARHQIEQAIMKGYFTQDADGYLTLNGKN